MAFRILVASSLLAMAAAIPASAGPPGTFRASGTEEFVFVSGCEFTPSPTSDLCGTLKSKGFGKADTETVITGFAPEPSGCFADTHTTTVHFKRDGSSLVLDIAGDLCPTGGQNFVFTGGYTIAGGTGEFAGATGAGSVTAVRQNGPIHEEFDGTLG